MPVLHADLEESCRKLEDNELLRLRTSLRLSQRRDNLFFGKRLRLHRLLLVGGHYCRQGLSSGVRLA